MTDKELIQLMTEYTYLKRRFERVTSKLKEELKQWKKDAENLFKTQTDNADKIINRYKQALDEIENYVRDNSDFDKSDKLTSNTGAYDILEIINEVKED